MIHGIGIGLAGRGIDRWRPWISGEREVMCARVVGQTTTGSGDAA